MEDATTGLGGLSLDQTPLYLLKTKSSPEDAYEEYFSNDGKYMPIFLPVLEHMLMDDALRKLRLAAERFAFAGGSPATRRQTATNNPAKKYGGIVFSSQRAVDAFAVMVAKLNPEKMPMLFDEEMPIYVVGPATAKGVQALGLPCPVVGEESGNGEALAKFIMEHQKTLSRGVTHLNGRKLPLLAVVGEQRRDIIPKTLQSDDLPVEDRTQVVEIVVYQTGESPSFEEEFTGVLQAAKRARVKEQWIIVFSPQGCEAMLSALGWIDEKTGKFNEGRREIMSGPMKTRVATIGPTTRDYLVATLGFNPDVCAEKPSPEGVGNGIASYVI